MNKKSLVTEIEIVYYNKNKASERRPVNCSRDAYDLLLKSWHMGRIESQEEFKILLLDSKNGCLGISNVAKGTLSSCEVDIKLIFATALKARAASIILAHNHPSGDVSPSEEDTDYTRRCQDVGTMLGLEIADHIVMTKENYCSFEQKRLL